MARPQAEQQVRLEVQQVNCRVCGEWMPVAYHAHRKLLTINGLVQLRVVVRRCRQSDCSLYQLSQGPDRLPG